ncbi:MAG: DUF2298 domain-containing protein [Acidobacteriia bacterium]|nr:DUF2298 domain-containing protein [Terriglobia bacterium]
MRVALTRARIAALALLAVALAVRLYGLNFDQSHFFHPDERRIAEAVIHLSFRPLQLDPHFFAYGSFPFYVTKLVTSVLSNVKPWLGTYDGAVLTGRALSAIWGTATVALLMLLARRLFGSRTALLAGALLGATVLHVQNSHFATNDVALTFLVLLSLVCMVAISESGSIRAYAAAGAAIGLAVATKFSALPLFVPLAVATVLRWRKERTLSRALGCLGVAGACALAAFAIAEPYALLDSNAWFHDIAEQSHMVRNAGDLPYTNQYVSVPKVLYDLREMVVWGMGPLLGLAAVIGTARRLRPKPGPVSTADWILLAWVVPFFAVTCSFDVKFVRYLLPIYPPLVLWAAAWLQGWAERARAGRWARGVVVAGTAAYLLAFLAIYARPHSAVTASTWFYDHAEAGSKVLTQDWDEGFPFSLPGHQPDRFKVVQFGFYETDSPAKVKHLANELASSDWLVLQTKRLYGAISRVPKKFPLTDNFFRELFAGDLGYTLVKEVASRPELFGIQLPTELADESFSVYDHPKAVIFRNSGRLGSAALETKIRNGLPSQPVSRSAMLRAAASGSTAGSADGLIRASLLATILCVLLLEALGVATYAVLRAALPARPGVYALAKVVGALCFVYLPWLATSLGVTSFSRPVLLATVVGIVAGGWLAGRSRREPWPERAELIASEVAFWGVFAFFLALRLLNPEVFWGEKPMDFSFLNTLYRADALPPPEPWFAGSPLMYTYFGHYAVAAVGKALAIQPSVMFNLGIVMVAGMTAAALFAAGALIGGSWRFGATAAAVTLFLGNLSGVGEVLHRRAVNFDYFWATSRVIPETINEYPFWSFVFADLHAHVLVMPWAVGFIALLALWLGRRAEPTAARPRTAATVLLVLSALMLGALTVTNGWSMPTYLALLLTLLGADWLVHRAHGGVTRVLRTAFVSVVLPATAIIGGALLGFRPFWRHFSLPARHWGPEVGPYAPPADVLTIFGGFLVLLVPCLFLTWRHILTLGEQRLPSSRYATMAAVAVALTLSLLDLRALAHLSLRQANSVSTFAVALAVFGLYLSLHRRTPERTRLPLLMFTFAMALIAGCEFVFVWDRMNTVFKFYLEAWFLLAIASSFVLWEVFRGAGRRERSRLVWQGVAGAAIAMAAFTSLSGAWGIVTHRHVNGPRFTLDGMAYLKGTNPHELAAFEWLNRNVRGLPVLAEAYGPSYQEFTRVCMNTGLPVVLGWDYHVFQRGHRHEDIERRKQDLETIYTSRTQEKVAAVLARYHVALVYVGPLERRTYAGANLANFKKWNDVLAPVYENPAVQIFAVSGNFVGVPPPLTVETVQESTEAKVPPAVALQDPPGVLRQPRGLASDRSGNLYVADFGNCRIQEFGPDLAPRAAWGRRGTAPGEFQDPCAVAIGPDGLLYVADTWNARVQVFDGTGTFIREWSANLYGARGIAVDATGAVFVADTGNARICRFSADGHLETEWGGRGAQPGKLAGPVGLAVDGAGKVLVCDNANSRLQVFDRDGNLLRVVPVPDWRAEVFGEPFVVVADDATIWITVPLRDQVCQYSPEGELLRTIVSGEGGAPTFIRPVGIALSPDGTALVVSTLDGHLRRLDTGARRRPIGAQPSTRRTPTHPRRAT